MQRGSAVAAARLRPVVRPVVLAIVLAAVGLLAGCGSASPPSPPTGVDGLVVPTPAIDPHNFVAGVDNPWLPLVQGASWTYDITGQTVQGGVGTMSVDVLAGTTAVDGVAATAVRTVVHGTTSAETTIDYFAQDTRGNVWWLGRRDVWQAGEHGAEAGLAMPAHPRRGDGWREAYLTGVVEDREQVAEVGDAFDVGGRRFTGVLDLAASSDLAPGITRLRSYARGVGLVRSYAASGPAELIELTGSTQLDSASDAASPSAHSG